jgi:enoyl-CoA hydratase
MNTIEEMISLETIEVTVGEHVAYAHLNRPHKANALNHKMWFEIEKLALWADNTPEVRVLVIAARGKNFCAGIDFSLIQSLFSKVSVLPDGHKQEFMYREVRSLQRAFNALEECRKPVIAQISGSCIGGGIDLITACDMRYAQSNSKFCVKEADLAIVADVGTIQRLPTLIGEGNARELAFTARTISADEAHRMGLINNIYTDKKSLEGAVTKIANTIAQKSPLTIRGTKIAYNYARDHSVTDGLTQVATWNASMLLSVDVKEAVSAIMEKRLPNYKN